MLHYLSTILECFCIILICKKYLSKKYRLTKYEILIITSDTLLANLVVKDNMILTFFLGQLMIFFFCLSNVKSFMNTLYLSMLAFITTFVSQTIATIPIAILASIIKNNDIIEPIANAVTFVVIYILLSTRLKKLYTQITTTTFTYKVALISFYLLLISLLILLQNNINFLYSNAVFFVIIVIIVIISNVLLLYYEKVISSKNMNIEYYERFLPIYESLINDIRASQHEFTNRIQALQILCDSQNTNTEFSALLHEYTSNYSKPLHAYPLLMLKSPLFVASLYSLYLDAESKGITVTFDVSCDKLNSPASEIVLTDLASILIQNAIEASKPGNNIYVAINSDDNRTNIEVRNIVEKQITDSEISNFFNNTYSTKNTDSSNKKHGFGLYYLNKQVNNYNGNILATCISHKDKYWMIFKLTI